MDRMRGFKRGNGPQKKHNCGMAGELCKQDWSVKLGVEAAGWVRRQRQEKLCESRPEFYILSPAQQHGETLPQNKNKEQNQKEQVC